jgi:hypothetical protein
MFREQLMQALHTAVGHYNSGSSDDDAVIKAAAACDFNKDQAERLVETFNTAKTIYFFKESDDRTGRFSTADVNVVIPALFSSEAVNHHTEEKTSADWSDYSFYETPERRYFDSLDRGVEFEKVSNPQDRSLELIAERAYKNIRVTKQTAERCLSTAGSCDVKYGQALDKLAQFMRQDYFRADKVADAEHGCWEACGKQLVDPVMDDVAARMPQDFADKRAEAHLEGVASDFDERNPKIVGLMKEAIECRLGFAEMAALHREFSKQAEEEEREFLKAADLVDPDETKPEEFFSDDLNRRIKEARLFPSNPIEKTAQPVPSKPKSKPAGGDFVGSAVDVLGKGVGGAVGEKQIQKGLQTAVTGPAQRQQKALSDRMRNLQRAAILQELLTTDPVLAGVDPSIITNGYMSLVRMAPEVSLDREVVRSVLRGVSTSVSIHPSEAKSWADLESAVQKQISQDGGKNEDTRR